MKELKVRNDSAAGINYNFSTDLDYWLQEIEAKLASDDLGRDMTSVETLLKKHTLIEADILAHNVIKCY